MEPRQKRTIPHQSSARLIALTAGLLAFAPINSFAAPNKTVLAMSKHKPKPFRERLKMRTECLLLALRSVN